MHARLILRFVGPLLVGFMVVGCLQSPEEKKAKHFERGVTYFENEQYKEAVIEFKNVVQIDPKDAHSFIVAQSPSTV